MQTRSDSLRVVLLDLAVFSLLAIGLFIALAAIQPPARASDKPAVIRFASPDQGTAGKPFAGAAPYALAQINKRFEEEFAKDGIKIEWTLFKGAGPAINEAFANKQVDFSLLGDLAAVIGRSRGLKTKLVLATGRGTNSYLAVTPESGIRSIKDLKGRKVTVFRGTAYQLPFDRVLADEGLTEKDLKLINMDWTGSKAALAAKEIDATWGGVDLVLLKEKGAALIPYSTRGAKASYTIQSGLIADEDFITRYPDITTRIVKVLIKAHQWASEEKHREELIRIYSETGGVPASVYRTEFEGDLRSRHSPRVDGFIAARFAEVVADAARYKLIREPFDVAGWLEPRFVDAALKELKLDAYWPETDAEGKAKVAPKADAKSGAQAAKKAKP